MNSLSNYSVNGIKTHRGHDGNVYSCNLLCNGKKVAEIFDDGWGGGLSFNWLNDVSAIINTLDYKGEPYSYEGTVDEANFIAMVDKLPRIPASDDLPEMSTSADIVIDDMVNDSIAEKKIKSDLKKKLTIKSKDGKFLTWKITPTHSLEVLKVLISKNYPESKIMNDLPIPEVIKLYKEGNLI